MCYSSRPLSTNLCHIGRKETCVSGNVEQLDATSTVSASQCSLSRTESDNPFSADDRISSQHDYAVWLGNNTHVILHVTSYIAGWIVKKIPPRVNCVTCQSTLISASIPIHSGHLFHLIEIMEDLWPTRHFIQWCCYNNLSH